MNEGTINVNTDANPDAIVKTTTDAPTATPQDSIPMSWNRLTNGQREELVKLPVWTTEDDRRRALAHLDHNFTGVQTAITAIRSGQKAPANFGVIVAVARYEDAGWLPDGSFNHWRRQVWQGAERMTAEGLIEWLGVLESNLQMQLLQSETRMTAQCQKQDEKVLHAQAEAQQARTQLHAHYETRILAQLSIGNIDEARAIARRAPTEFLRAKLSSLLPEHSCTAPQNKPVPPVNISANSAETARVQDIVREACIAELFAGMSPSDIVPRATAIAQRAVQDLLDANAVAYHAAQYAHAADLEALTATRRELNYWRSASQATVATSRLFQAELDKMRTRDYADRMATEIAALSAEEREALLHSGVLRANTAPIDIQRDKPTPRWAACTTRSKLSREQWRLAPVEPGFSPIFYACRLRSPDGRCRYCGTQLIDLQTIDEPRGK